MIHFTVISIFPSLVASSLDHSILKKAREKGILSVSIIDPRDHASGRHRITDDYPYGGGQGMVMKPEPLVAAIEAAKHKFPHSRVILLSPRGRVFDQAAAARLAQAENLALVCGRYEGVDERVRAFCDEELSIGDFTLSGGEPAATVIIDAVARLIPGVLGNEKSAEEDSFSDGLLEYPQYTRPEEYRGMKVPEVLLSGDHARVNQWRRVMSVRLTAERRPDLLAQAELTKEEKEQVLHCRAPLYLALLHHPVYDKNGQVVTTAVTNMDIHDIARAARTYGARAFYVVTPVRPLQKLALKIIAHWQSGYGSQYNATRKEALALVRIKDGLDDVLIDLDRDHGEKPCLVVTSAKRGSHRTSFARLR
ncbi:MAG TPA: tRNA (guanosine(37)-N1)-methyltransferase TrmD, partial [Terriglobales bacterium]|nr:tRNA (guanosine(37)-N1)-methyltransferase TrmD [Terriglobales bacterium]